MRKKLLLSLFLLLSTTLIYSQSNQSWKWSHETPQGNTLRYVKMFDANNWYAAGLYGTFMKTTNAGATWTVSHKASYPGTANGAYGSIYDGHFFNQNNGILVGQYGMVRTTNGGTTWDTVVGLPTSATWYQVYFRDANVGFAAGTSTGRIAKTTDGGATWSLITTITSATYYDVWSPNDQLIVAATSSSSVQRSTDGGTTWTLVATGGTQSNYKMTFASDNLTGYIAGSATTVRKTTDAGLTWTLVNTGIPTSTFYDCDLVGSTVYVTGNSYAIYKSTDAGTTWDTVGVLAPVASQPWTSTYYCTDFVGTDLVTVGAFGLFNSRFGGNIKTYTQFKKAGLIRDVWCNPLTNTIVTVGAPSSTGAAFDQIFVSTNSGVSWNLGTTTLSPKLTTAVEIPVAENKEETKEDFEMLTPTSNSTFYSLDMVSSTVGFACGSLSAVYKTTNGGLTWDSLTTTITPGQTLTKIDFVSPTVGWVFSSTTNAAGNIWKTTDGGLTWVQSILTGQTGSAANIYSSHMLNANVGWITNFTPNPFKTTDGGATWVMQNIDGWTAGYLYGIYMINETTGFLGGSSGGKFYKTTDGGANWVPQTMPAATAGFYSIKFITPTKGIVVGTAGVTMITLDCGDTWTLLNNSGGGFSSYNVWAAKGVNDSLYAITVGASGGVMTYGVYTVPVELTSLTASVVKDAVTLNWATATETNNKGFSLERKSSTGIFNEIAFINGKGTTTEQQKYSYTETLQNGRYTYRLRQVDFNGASDLSKEVEVIIGAPEAYSLAQNYPNPFNPSTTIKYAIPFDGMVNIAIYNTLGEKVATVLNQQMLAGNYEVSFDASNLSTGVYFYRLESGSFVSVKKMMLLK